MHAAQIFTTRAHCDSCGGTLLPLILLASCCSLWLLLGVHSRCSFESDVSLSDEENEQRRRVKTARRNKRVGRGVCHSGRSGQMAPRDRALRN